MSTRRASWGLSTYVLGADRSYHQLKTIALKVYTVGNALRENPASVNDASLWLQTGLELISKAEKMGSPLVVQDLKVRLG